MELTFKDANGNTEVLANSDDIAQLREAASQKYAGSELIIWKSGPSGKPYNEQVPEVPCTCSFNDGSSFSIS